MKLLAIVEANLRRLMRDRAALFYTMLLPFVLIVLLGVIFGGAAFTRVGVVVQDEGPLGESLVASLERSDELSIRRYSEPADLIAAVERQQLVAGVIVPEDYSRAIADGRQVAVRFVAEDNQYAPSFGWDLDAAIADQNVELGAAQTVAGLGTDTSFARSLSLARATRPQIGAVTVDERTVSMGEVEPWGQFELVASQQLVLMVFLVALVASTQVVRTRELGVARRMLATPTRTSTILAGEALSRFALALLQAALIVLVTAVVFDVDWGDPVAAGALVAAFALVGSGAAVLVGTVARNESQAMAIGLFVALSLAAVGGSMQPLEFFSPTMLTIAHLTPHAWALDGFETLIRGGGTIGDILPELAALAAFALVLMGVSTWRLRRALS